MENESPIIEQKIDQNSAPENLPQNPDENFTLEKSPSQAEQMTLENMTTEVAKIYDGFDPSKHAVNPDGTPKKRADGQYASKRGRKPGSGSSATEPTTVSAPASPAVAPLSVKKARESGLVTNKAAAHATVKSVVTLLGSTVGPEWDFESPEEAQAMIDAVSAYYDANGQINMSPEMMLSFQVIAYSVPRVQHPNTKSKLEKAWEYTKNFFKFGG